MRPAEDHIPGFSYGLDLIFGAQLMKVPEGEREGLADGE